MPSELRLSATVPVLLSLPVCATASLVVINFSLKMMLANNFKDAIQDLKASY